MTDQELRDLVASLGVKHAELADLQAQTQRQLQETDRQLEENARYTLETERVLREADQEIDRQLKETDRQTNLRLKETDRYLKDLGKQLGGLGEKFGGFTEGMAFPSMEKILRDRFLMDFVAPRVRVRRNGQTVEIDVLAYSNSGRDEVFVVEVKSRLRQEGLEQMRKLLRDFREIFPEHAGKKVYGILATVDAPEELMEQVLREGIYLARIHDEEFVLQVPPDFQPRVF